MTTPGNFAADLSILFKRKSGRQECLEKLRPRIEGVRPSLGVLVLFTVFVGYFPLSLTSYIYIERTRINTSRHVKRYCQPLSPLLVHTFNNVLNEYSHASAKCCRYTDIFELLAYAIMEKGKSKIRRVSWKVGDSGKS